MRVLLGFLRAHLALVAVAVLVLAGTAVVIAAPLNVFTGVTSTNASHGGGGHCGHGYKCH